MPLPRDFQELVYNLTDARTYLIKAARFAQEATPCLSDDELNAISQLCQLANQLLRVLQNAEVRDVSPIVRPPDWQPSPYLVGKVSQRGDARRRDTH